MLVGSSRHRGSLTVVAPLRRSAAPCVLVVDDDDLVREVVVAVLRGTGHDVESARNGAEALDRVAQHDRFHLVLLDVQMPVMDGWSTITELRARGYTTPVVMMSGHATEDEALRYGAEALLQKPFDHARLVDAVARWAKPALDAAAG